MKTAYFDIMPLVHMPIPKLTNFSKFYSCSLLQKYEMSRKYHTDRKFSIMLADVPNKPTYYAHRQNVEKPAWEWGYVQ